MKKNWKNKLVLIHGRLCRVWIHNRFTDFLLVAPNDGNSAYVVDSSYVNEEQEIEREQEVENLINSLQG